MQEALLATARINLDYTHIVAPVDGVLGQRQVRPGQYVAAGQQITTLIPLPRVWVIANFRETQLTHMAVGEQGRGAGRHLSGPCDAGARAVLLPRLRGGVRPAPSRTTPPATSPRWCSASR